MSKEVKYTPGEWRPAFDGRVMYADDACHCAADGSCVPCIASAAITKALGGEA